MRPTALVAEDEPLLRDALVCQLARAWPELVVVAQARNGREAMRLFDEHRPDVCFLDVHMPGVSGLEAARHVGSRAHLVFVTAYDDYAVQAFERGALDYLLKPVAEDRLAETVARLKERLAQARPALGTERLLELLAERLGELEAAASLQHSGPVARGTAPPAPLGFVRAQVGQNLRLIAVDDIDYVRSDAKYTVVAFRDDEGAPGEAVVRTPLKDLLGQLDATRFVQVHRSVVVNLSSIRFVRRRENETAEIHLKGRKEVLPVSRAYLHLFRQT